MLMSLEKSILENESALYRHFFIEMLTYSIYARVTLLSQSEQASE